VIGLTMKRVDLGSSHHFGFFFNKLYEQRIAFITSKDL